MTFFSRFSERFRDRMYAAAAREYARMEVRTSATPECKATLATAALAAVYIVAFETSLPDKILRLATRQYAQQLMHDGKYGAALESHLGLSLPSMAVASASLAPAASPQLPEFPPTEVLVPQSRLLDRNGMQLANLSPKNYERVQLHDIAPHLVNALVAAEDANFYEHPGIDVHALSRAAYRNARAGEFKEGGSTIEQQLVRNVHLSREKALGRKFNEIALALEWANTHTKSETLEEYLNLVEFGNAIGIRAAAMNNFGVEPKQLDLPQSAHLVGLLKSPGRHKDTNWTDRRQAYVLRRMVEEKYISPMQSATALNTDLQFSGVAPAHLDRQLEDIVLREVQILHPDLLQEGTYKVVSTFDLDLQRIAEQAIRQVLSTPELFDENGKDVHALALLYLPNGELLSVADQEVLEGLYHPQGWISAMQDRLQWGSLGKPILAAIALEDSMSLDDQFLNHPFLRIRDEGGIRYWPKNWDNSVGAPMTLRDALISSSNIPFADLAVNYLGVQKVYDRFCKAGLSLVPEDQNVSLSLGGPYRGVPLTELAGMFCAFPQKGQVQQPFSVKSILNLEGTPIYEHHSQPHPAFAPDAAEQVFEVLKQIPIKGTAKSIKKYFPTLTDGTLAGKTGSSDRGAAFFGWYMTPHAHRACAIPDTLGILIHVAPRPGIDARYGSQWAVPIAGEILKSIENYHANAQALAYQPEGLHGQSEHKD